MSHHRVHWDEQEESLDFVCEATPDVDWCRIRWDDECRCETFTQPVNEGDGTWSHKPSKDSPVVHRGRWSDTEHCNYLEFIEAGSYDEALDMCAGAIADQPRHDDDDRALPWPSGPIAFTWEGDWYSWDYLAEVPA